MAIHQIYIIAGEPSGDQLGGRLINSIKEKMVGNIEFFGVGGPEMEAQGLQSIFPMSELSVMGLMEVLPRLPNILRRIKHTVNHILKTQPDVVVTIDSPDFSFRIVKELQGKGIPLIHYVAPSVWAWKPSRAKKLADKLDHLLTLLPFEAPFFEDKGLSSSFVGHPVIESGFSQVSGLKFRADHNIPANEPVLCLLPGSRINEVNKILPIIRDTIDGLDILDLHTVLPIVETVKSEVYENIQNWRKKPIIVDKNENIKWAIRTRILRQPQKIHIHTKWSIHLLLLLE